METNIDKYRQILEKIDQLANNDENFRNILCKKYGGIAVVDNGISENVLEIRKILRIEASPSIDFSFIPDEFQWVRDRLIIDNLRMENSLLDVKVSNEFERFYNFCTNAFYQIENLINYYYYRRFPNINDFLDYLEKTNKIFHRTQNPVTKETKEKNVGDVDIAIKLYSFNMDHFPSLETDFTGSILDNLRKVRNEGFHRCAVIQKKEEANKKLHNFFKYQTFNTVRDTVKKVAEITHPIKKTHKATITNLLPSACFVKYESGDIENIQMSLIKNSNVKNGDNVIITYTDDCGNKIINGVEKI